jgi:hypothetical protein
MSQAAMVMRQMKMSGRQTLSIPLILSNQTMQQLTVNPQTTQV